MQIKVNPWDFYKYREVFQIIEMRDNCVYKTKSTGKFIKSGEPLPDGFVAAEISLSTKAKTIELF